MADGPMSTPRRPAPRSIGTPTMRISPSWRLLTCYIVVEAAARFAPEISGGDHLSQQRRRGEARFLEFVEQDVGDVERRIEADEVEQREGAHRIAGAQHHADVDVLARGKALLEHAHGF